MTNRIQGSIVGVLLMTFLFTGTVWAQLSADEARLQAAQGAIDSEASTGAAKSKVDVLARQFQVPTSVVEDLRNKKQGWGEITIQLAMAQHLSSTDPQTYPALTDALTQIEALRGDGKGYGNIAKELGFKLGPVISEVQRARQEFRAEIRGNQPSERTRAEGRTETRIDEGKDRERIRQEFRAEHRVDRLDRVERPERPERPPRPERPERLGR